LPLEIPLTIQIHRLVLPLVIRQTVNITNSGFNFTETTDLSTFGFLYGTFPSAPGVFVVASRYNTDVDLVSFWAVLPLESSPSLTIFSSNFH
jgi:hypothetical protein